MIHRHHDWGSSIFMGVVWPLTFIFQLAINGLLGWLSGNPDFEVVIYILVSLGLGIGYSAIWKLATDEVDGRLSRELKDSEENSKKAIDYLERLGERISKEKDRIIAQLDKVIPLHSQGLRAIETRNSRVARVGEFYYGTVVRIRDFGADIELFPGTVGLVHISQLDMKSPDRVRDVLEEGDKVLVKCLEIFESGDISEPGIILSRKEALETWRRDIKGF